MPIEKYIKHLVKKFILNNWINKPSEEQMSHNGVPNGKIILMEEQMKRCYDKYKYKNIAQFIPQIANQQQIVPSTNTSTKNLVTKQSTAARQIESVKSVDTSVTQETVDIDEDKENVNNTVNKTKSIRLIGAKRAAVATVQSSSSTSNITSSNDIQISKKAKTNIVTGRTWR